jgi:hypothetical protein
MGPDTSRGDVAHAPGVRKRGAEHGHRVCAIEASSLNFGTIGAMAKVRFWPRLCENSASAACVGSVMIRQ